MRYQDSEGHVWFKKVRRPASKGGDVYVHVTRDDIIKAASEIIREVVAIAHLQSDCED